jgi:two-component system cell cycle sensor histidine kinase/response regulator CckA
VRHCLLANSKRYTVITTDHNPMDRSDSGRQPFLNNPLFALIVEHAPACIALLRGPDFIYEIVNPAYAAIRPGVPMLGLTLAEVFPEPSVIVLPHLRAVLETGIPFRAEDQPFTIVRDRQPVTAYFTFSFTRVTDGDSPQTHSILVLAIETTARKIAEEQRELALSELQQQRRLFETALSNSPDANYVMTRKGRFIYANRTLLDRWHRTLDEVIGKDFFELGYPHDLATTVHRQIDELVRTGLPVHGETPLSIASGGVRSFEYIFVPVFDESGEVEAVAGSTRDITERRRAEAEELQHRERLLGSARLESLGVMAGGIAHDFNNLLTGILGNSSLLADGYPDPDRHMSKQIVLAAERAADLTRQMLAFSGKGRFVIDVFDLNTLVQENLTLLRASLARCVTVEIALRPEGCPVEADRGQIQQVIMNLLINASEAVGDRPGNVVIRTLLTRHDESCFSPQTQTNIPAGSYAVLVVQDNGCGMTPETAKRIFDPFFTTKFTGRGLGLAAVLGIVKGHRGDIQVVSDPGKGTTFRVLLPAASPPSVISSGSALLKTRQTSGQLILIVDDEEFVRKAASAALEMQGFRVLHARNGEEALASLRSESAISLVILDLTMPVMTGEQAIPLIQSIRPGVPIILSSGFGEIEITRRFAASGIADVLEKPYNITTILSKVTRILT